MEKFPFPIPPEQDIAIARLFLENDFLRREGLDLPDLLSAALDKILSANSFDTNYQSAIKAVRRLFDTLPTAEPKYGEILLKMITLKRIYHPKSA
jgi:hypothetical protein